MIIRMFGGLLGLLIFAVFGGSFTAEAIRYGTDLYKGLFWSCFGILIVFISNEWENTLEEKRRRGKTK